MRKRAVSLALAFISLVAMVVSPRAGARQGHAVTTVEVSPAKADAGVGQPRLQLEQRVHLHGIEIPEMASVVAGDPVRDSDGTLAAEAAIPEQPTHIVEASEAPQAEIFPEEGAGLAVQPAIGLVGILDEALFMRIEM